MAEEPSLLRQVPIRLRVEGVSPRGAGSDPSRALRTREVSGNRRDAADPWDTESVRLHDRGTGGEPFDAMSRGRDLGIQDVEEDEGA
jgi:hypothetical protein